MKDITPYLMFDGNCREAMTFYAKCLGAELQIMPYSQAPGDIPAEAKDRVMHARLGAERTCLMASDSMIGQSHEAGGTFSVSVQCESLQEIEAMFTALGENGKVTLALHDAFWGARFGMLTDQFGINWMFSFELPKSS